MSYGLRTYSDNGTVELDTTVFTYRVLHNAVYKLNGSNNITVSVPGFSTSIGVACILPIGAPSGAELAKEAMPYVAVSNGQVVIRSKNPSEPSSDASFGSQIQFRLLVMRYR